MHDDVLYYILEGVYDQCEIVDQFIYDKEIFVKKIKTQYLRTFIYSNNQLGLKSCNMIK